MFMIRILGIAVIALTVAACSKTITQKKHNQPISNLAGSEWGPVENPHDQFVGFKSKGEMVGSGGCNNFFGSYTQNGNQITVGPLASTKKMCRDSMEAENDFLNRLKNARTVEATHFELSLFDADGAKLLSLQRRDWD